MPYHRSSSTRAVRRTVSLAATLAVAATATAFPAASARAATGPQIQAGLTAGSDYLAAQQAADGGIPEFAGDWAIQSLAAAGVDASTVRTAADSPSAQDYLLGLWTGGPDSDDDWTSPSGQKPGGLPGELRRPAADYVRALLIAQSAGLQPTRLSADQNLLAQIAGVYRGRPTVPDVPGAGRTEGTLGAFSAFGGTVYGLLALARADAPQALLDQVARTLVSHQLNNGGWSYGPVSAPADRRGPSDLDTTGVAIAALCEAGVDPHDPAVTRAVDMFQDQQLDNGGFVGEWSPNGNSSSAAVAVVGLNACGIDPQGPAFTSDGGKTPVDYLLDLQLTSGPDAGSFAYQPGDTGGSFYSTQDAVRALSGESFASTPRTVRPAPAVAAGTVVPQAVVIDAGVDETGERDLRFCRVQAPTGASVAHLLQRAATTAEPAGCVTDLDLQDGAVRSLNGVTGDRAQRRWLASVEGGAARIAGAQPVGHGQLVSLSVGRTADVDPTPQPPSDPAPHPPAPAPAPAPGTTPPAPVRLPSITVAGTGRDGKKQLRLDRHGRITLTLRCPVDAGARGCTSIVTAQAKVRLSPRGEARNRRVGGRTVAIKAGKSKRFSLKLTAALRRDLRRAGTRALRIQVRTPGSSAVATTKVTLRG